jgi:hypothetical protein
MSLPFFFVVTGFGLFSVLCVSVMLFALGMVSMSGSLLMGVVAVASGQQQKQQKGRQVQVYFSKRCHGRPQRWMG